MIKKIMKSTDNSTISVALLLLRLMFGLGMAFGHGYSKLLKFFADEPLSFGDPLNIGVPASLTLAVFAEFFCGILLALGLLTRAVAIPLFITMAVAIFIVHAGDPFGRIEKALMYLVVYAALILTGGGKYSIDSLLVSRK